MPTGKTLAVVQHLVGVEPLHVGCGTGATAHDVMCSKQNSVIDKVYCYSSSATRKIIKYFVNHFLQSQ